MLTDEEREPGIHLSLPYFLGARSKICRIRTQIYQVLCFVGKDWNYFEFNRKTDVWGTWRKYLEQMRALAERTVWQRDNNRPTENINGYKRRWKFHLPPCVRPRDVRACGRGLRDWQWLTPGDADSSYERQRTSSAGNARVQPDTWICLKLCEHKEPLVNNPASSGQVMDGSARPEWTCRNNDLTWGEPRPHPLREQQRPQHNEKYLHSLSRFQRRCEGFVFICLCAVGVI